MKIACIISTPEEGKIARQTLQEKYHLETDGFYSRKKHFFYNIFGTKYIQFCMSSEDVTLHGYSQELLYQRILSEIESGKRILIDINTGEPVIKQTNKLSIF